MEISNWIALASLLFSVFAFVWALTAKTEAKENQKRLQEFELSAHKEREDERKKALIDARVYKVDGDWAINVYNKGAATARNIRLVIPDEKTTSESIPFIDTSSMPYPFLHHGGCFDMILYKAEGGESIAVVRFIWDDDFKNNNERNIVLNL